MTEYYRVRSQKQWDWLMKYFEKVDKGIRWDYSGEKPTEYNNWKKFKSNSYIALLGDVTLFYGDVERDELSDFIEVSNLMEDEKMKAEGEPMTEIVLDDIYQVNHGVRFENGKKIKFVTLPTSKLYPKVPMTEAEKKEFDKLKDEMSLGRHDLDDLLTRIKDSEDFPSLYHCLYVADGDGDESQLEFARAWAGPSLIEVIPEDKYWVKCYPTDDCYFYKYEGKILAGVPRVHLERFQFTTDEIVEYHLDGTENIFEKVEVSE